VGGGEGHGPPTPTQYGLSKTRASHIQCAILVVHVLDVAQDKRRAVLLA